MWFPFVSLLACFIFGGTSLALAFGEYIKKEEADNKEVGGYGSSRRGICACFLSAGASLSLRVY